MVAIDACGMDSELIPRTADNLIARVASGIAARRGRTLPPFRMTITNEIPLARGLGSSAAAIIAGITCYELVSGEKLTDPEIFRYACEYEPHPDNLAAAFRGGLVAAVTTDDGEVLVSKLSVPDGLRIVVVIPAFELRTEKARAVLPENYSRKDAVYNIQRSALTVAALTTGNWVMLREAMRDRLHQPYRAPLIPGLAEILALNLKGLLGIALSGAGPTVLALTTPGDVEDVGRAVSVVFEKHGIKSAPHFVQIDTVGRFVEP
jgi:homoserine kinase